MTQPVSYKRHPFRPALLQQLGNGITSLIPELPSGGETEDPTYEMAFTCCSWPSQHAVTPADHPYHLKSFYVAEAVAILWKPRAGRMTRLSAP